MAAPAGEHLELTADSSGILFWVKVAPGARHNRLGDIHAGALKVAVTAAPEKGKANQAVLRLLQQKLGIASQQLEMVRGQTQSLKRIRIEGLTAAQLLERLGIAQPPTDRRG